MGPETPVTRICGELMVISPINVADERSMRSALPVREQTQLLGMQITPISLNEQNLQGLCDRRPDECVRSHAGRSVVLARATAPEL
jgi:hypothetical protein